MHTLIQIWAVTLLLLGIGEIGKLSSENEFYFDLLSRCCIGVLIGSIAGTVLAWAFLG